MGKIKINKTGDQKCGMWVIARATSPVNTSVSFTSLFTGRQTLVKQVTGDVECGKYIEIKRLAQKRKEW